MGFDDVPEIARTQAGLFTRSQAYDAGWTKRQVRRPLEVGRWTVVAGAALGSPGLQVGPRQLAHAVVLTWPGAVISHELAGSLWSFPIPEAAVGTATARTDRHLVGKRLSSCRTPLPQDDVGLFGGLPTTTRTRTALDLLAAPSWDRARDLWAWFSTRAVLDRVQLAAAVEARARWKGTAQLRRLLAVTRGGSLSAAEDRLHGLLTVAGIRGWVANMPVLIAGRVIAVVDVLFEEERVAIEIDGWAVHSGRTAFQLDRTRQNALVAAGFSVLRFTWDDLVKRPDDVLRIVRSALMLASRRRSPG